MTNKNLMIRSIAKNLMIMFIAKNMCNDYGEKNNVKMNVSPHVVHGKILDITDLTRTYEKDCFIELEKFAKKHGLEFEHSRMVDGCLRSDWKSALNFRKKDKK